MPNGKSDRIKTVHYTPRFLKSLSKLPHRIKQPVEQKDKIFRHNPFDVQLHTHKLKGELTGIWSYSVNYNYRILFRFIDKESVMYYDIGTHEIYR
jgi:addiction module RelE/StbE family toxin